jgi:hypothetical protein
LREEHRLRVFENRVLRRVFGSKRGKVTGVFFFNDTATTEIYTPHPVLFKHSNCDE